MGTDITIGELFSGYGGLGMGVQQALGGHTIWHAEIEPAACAVLEHRYPDVPNLGDVTTVDWSQVEAPTVLTGGSPCQDVSESGRRAGMKAGTRSGLWSAMVDAVEVLRPELVVWENVRGVLSAEADSDVESGPGLLGDTPDGPALRALGRVLGDLAGLGYVGRWHSVRASDVGAPHARPRVFVTAWPAADAAGPRLEGRRRSRPSAQRPGPARDRADAHAAGRLSADLEGWDGDWAGYEPAIRRWEAVLGRPAPAPAERAARGSLRLSPRFVEWLMGLPAGHVTDVPGLKRDEMIKMLGNGVVPAAAAHAVTAMLGASAHTLAA